MEQRLEFNNDNIAEMSGEKLWTLIKNENKVTVILKNGFNKNSDTEDVFRGLMGDAAFENDDEFLDAIECGSKVKRTFFLSNATDESPFNEKGMVNRLLKDDFWTSVILHDRPLKNGFYAMVQKSEK